MKEYLPYIAVLIAASGFAFSHLRTRAMSDVVSDLAVLKKQMELFWGIVETKVGDFLHSPHREELDRLIDKNARTEWLSLDEVMRFQTLLLEISNDGQATSEDRTNATLLLAALSAKYCITPFDEFSRILAERPSGLELFGMEIAA